MKVILLFLSVLFSLQTFALSFTSERPLKQHLLEVNPEWKNHPEVLNNLEYTINFNSETERIQAHLHQVIELILSHSTPENAAMRENLMHQLAVYADEGNFPVNTQHQSRRPYFIDYKGTPCAVGFLMLNNGFSKEANLVHETMNPAYIREIPGEWLQTWINYSLLSLDELALIQPGYPPSTIWNNLGNQISGEINAMIEYNGTIYIAGDFSVDGISSSFARINGESVETVETLNGIARDMEVFDGKIWIAGAFNSGYNDLAVWDGNDLTYTGAFLSKYGEAYDLHVHDNQLYVSGFSTGFVGSDYLVSKLEGDYWLPMGKFNEAVLSIEFFNNQLVAAGNFSSFFDEGWNEIPASHIAVFDGNSWSEMGGGIESTVRNLEIVGGDIWACADLFDGEGNPGFGLGHFQDANWHSITDPLAYQLPLEPLEGQGFRDILEVDNMIITCGKFFNPEIFIIGGSLGSIAEFGGEWGFSSMITPFSGVMNELMSAGSVVYAGGNFEEFMNEHSDLVFTDLSTDIPERFTEHNLFNIYPNPANHRIQVNVLPNVLAEQVCISGLDGRIIKAFANYDLERINYSLNLEEVGLNNGIYFITMQSGSAYQTLKFVKY